MSSIPCKKKKKSKLLLNLIDIHKTRHFEIFNFENSKSVNFPVVKLESVNFRVWKLNICQFPSFKKKKKKKKERQNDKGWV